MKGGGRGHTDIANPYRPQCRTWKGEPYANVIDDGTGCGHMLTLEYIRVACDGFRALGKPPPPETVVPRQPAWAFDHPEEEDPMRAVGPWLKEKMQGVQSRQRTTRRALQTRHDSPHVGDEELTGTTLDENQRRNRLDETLDEDYRT